MTSNETKTYAAEVRLEWSMFADSPQCLIKIGSFRVGEAGYIRQVNGEFRADVNFGKDFRKSFKTAEVAKQWVETQLIERLGLKEIETSNQK